LEDVEATSGLSLFGTTAEDKAVTRMWSRRIEQQIVIPMMSWFRWGAAKDLFAKRGHHGARIWPHVSPLVPFIPTRSTMPVRG
jgi:hypothetical protein